MSPKLFDRVGEVRELDVVGAARAQYLDHDPLSVRDRERVGLNSRLAFPVVAVQNVIPVAEPNFRNRAVARYADPIFYIHQCPVGRYFKGYFHGFRTVALDRSRHERAVVVVVESCRNLQLDAVLLEFVVVVLVILKLSAVEVPAVEDSVGIVLGIDEIESVVLPRPGAVLLVDPSIMKHGILVLKRRIRE